MIKRLRVTVDGHSYDVTVELPDETAATPGVLSPPAPATKATPAAAPAATPPPATPPAAPAPVPAASGPAGPGDVPCPLAGRVTAVVVTVGQEVKEGDHLLTLEAMKMNTFVFAPKNGKIAEVKTAVGATVEEGHPVIQVDPAKIVGVVETNLPDETNAFPPVGETTARIGNNVAEFLAAEIKRGLIPAAFLPVQSGVGDTANAVLMAMADHPDIPNFQMYTEVIQDSVIALMHKGRVTFASGSSLTVPPPTLEGMYKDWGYFRSRLLLRPQEITNNPEVVRRIGTISVNTALEVDLSGNVNSTHVLGRNMMNGIGGSADFARAAFLSIFICPSTAKDGMISTIVPMVSHLDSSEHSVSIVVTEQGVADLRGRAPSERARLIIENCAHPEYRPLLREYVARGGSGHTLQSLGDAFKMHLAYGVSGDMRQAKWS